MSANLVVVGYGLGLNQRLEHCEVIRKTKGLNFHGVCEPVEVCREEACRFYDVRGYADIEEVVSDDHVDVVVIATPNESHARLALRCLEAGKHVILEKPMCLTTAEADALIDSSRRHQRLLTVRHNRRWDGDYLTIKKVIGEGSLGPLFVLDSSLSALIRPSNWRSQKSQGGGWFVDWGCHLIDQILDLVPSPPVSVFAVIASRGWQVEVETYARVLLQFKNGIISEIETSNISWVPRQRWYVLGEKGSLVYSGGKFLLRTANEEKEIVSLKSRDHEFYANFSTAINEGNELAVKPEQVRQVIAIIEAAFRSAETGQAVRLASTP